MGVLDNADPYPVSGYSIPSVPIQVKDQPTLPLNSKCLDFSSLDLEL